MTHGPAGETETKGPAVEKIGRKPELEGETGTENPIADTSEVGGRGRQLLYKCYHDGAENYVQIWGNGYFLCWKCGALNYK
jgi:hypothetical protein